MIQRKLNLLDKTNLFDENGLEGDEHEQGKYAVVPVLIQAPQTHAEDLEHEEWSSSSLPEELPEVWQSHIQPAQREEETDGEDTSRLKGLQCWYRYVYEYS